MANFITITSPSPRVTLNDAGTRQIAIVSPSPRVGIFGAGVISITSVSPLVSLTGTAPQFNIVIHSPSAVFSVDGLVGELANIEVISPSPEVAFSGSTSVLGTLQLVSPFPGILVDGLTGNIGEIVIVSPSPGVDWNELPLVLGQIAVISPSPILSLHGNVIPVTFNRKAIVMHLFNYAVSEYKNYNFNCLLHFNGVFLGLNEDGVYILDGNDDLGELIQARIKSGVEDFAKDGAITIPREAWLAYRSDDGMQLDIRVDEDEDLPSIIFNKVARKITECREKLDRGIKGRFFTWDLKNVNGSDFSLESLRVLGDIIKRKTR